MPRHGAVGGFGLEGFPVGGGEHGGHEPEGPEALRDDVGLHVAVVVFEGHDVPAAGFEHVGDHVVDLVGRRGMGLVGFRFVRWGMRVTY